jgi:hypothetical protein
MQARALCFNMHWINLHTSVLRAPEFIGSEPVSRATWLSLLGYCVDQENGGRIEGAAVWKDRQWQQTAGVTAEEVRSSAPLVKVQGADVIVWSYPQEKEVEVRRLREIGRIRSAAKAAAAKMNGARGGRPSTNPTRNRTETEQKTHRKEGKGKERNVDPSDLLIGASAPVTDDGGVDRHFVVFWDSYPRKVSKADAKRSYARLLHRNPPAFVAELQSKVVAYAAAVAKWPEADRQFIPYPATWLNKAKYEEDPAEWQRSNAPDGFRARPASESTSEAEKAAHQYEY